MSDRIPKSVYTFRVPRLDQDLDIRDYELREVEGTYLLHRKEFPDFGLLTSTEPIKMHPAQFIFLNGATSEMAQELLKMFPELKPIPSLST